MVGSSHINKQAPQLLCVVQCELHTFPVESLALSALSVFFPEWVFAVKAGMAVQLLHEIFPIPVLVYCTSLKQFFDVLVKGYVEFIVFRELSE